MKVFKCSAELLNQKKIKDQLVKQKNFIEADKVHHECVNREAQERDNFDRMRQEKIAKELSTLRMRQKKEHEGFLRTEQRILDEMNKKFSNEKKKTHPEIKQP